MKNNITTKLPHFILISVLFNLFSCSNNKMINLTDKEQDIYRFIHYDSFGNTTAGPMLAFQDQKNKLIFVLSPQDNTFYHEDEKDYYDWEKKLSSILRNPEYEELQVGKLYNLKLHEIEDVNYIKPRKVTTNPLMETINPTVCVDLMVNDQLFRLYYVKNWKLQGKIYTCDQIYADFILKSARMVNK